MAMPSTALSSSAIEPASAVTSPSLTTSNGMPFQAACRSKKRRRMRLSNASLAARRGRASRRGPRWRRRRPRRCRRWHRRAADVRRRAAANRRRRRSGTAGRLCTAGFHGTSSLKTTLPSMTAAHLRSLAPRSKPMRQPSRWRPSGRGGLAFRGRAVERDALDRHGTAVDAVAHELIVEGARAGRASRRARR